MSASGRRSVATKARDLGWRGAGIPARSASRRSDAARHVVHARAFAATCRGAPHA